ncbi:MAG: hypothetical protein NT015_05370 [Alphaproteobacteria bacterium]|nr:hypothetical protein [Alphaproteobacteria bacterium]
MINRRVTLAGLSALALSNGAAAQTTDAETTEIILDTLGTDLDSVAGSGATATARRGELIARIAGWTNEPPPSAPTWPAYARSLDFIPNVADAPDRAELTLTGDVLAQLSRRLAFRASDRQKTILAIRGATLAKTSDIGSTLTSVRITRVKPNHLDLNCLMGVWDRAQGTITLYPGSTVPEFTHMRVNLGRIGGCNISPLGFYEYVVGLHGRTKRYKQPGAFLQGREVFVLRTTHNAAYDVSDADCYWDRGWFGNNMHSAILRRTPKFSSAGCLVVRGYYDRNGWLPQEDFAAFRLTAGLSARTSPDADLTTPEDGQRVQTMLISFSDLHAETTGRFGARRFLRYGSSGADVRALQARLGRTQTGSLDAATMEAWIARQQADGRQEYPIAEVV